MRSIGIFFAALAFVLPARADSTVITEVSLFKNGLGYFIEEGRFDPAIEELVLGAVPPAVHGTYWVSTNPSIISGLVVRASSVDSLTRREAASISEILAANIGREVELVLETVTRKGIITYADKNYVVLESEGRQEVIPMHFMQIRSEKPLARTVTDTHSVPALRLAYHATQEAPFMLSYLRKGITWAPAYRIDIKDSPGWFAMQAVVINEAADLNHVDLRFISGYPNIAFSEVVSPLAMAGSLADFLIAIGGGNTSTRWGGGVMAQSLSNAPYYEADAAKSVYSAAGTGEQTEDLFYYTLRDITLPKNERAAFELFSGPLPFEHVYSWDIPIITWNPYINQNVRADNPPEDVWHFVKFKNIFPQPVTTGPALIVSGDKLIAQDILHYTPSEGLARVRITKAMDIKAEREEVEINRDRQSRVLRNQSYDLVTVEGTLTLQNFKAEAVLIEISKMVEGEFISSTHKVDAVKVAESLNDVNPRTRMKWEITIPANGTVEIGYRYKLYVP